MMWRKARISRTFSIVFIGLAEATVLINTARMFYVLYTTRSETESSDGIKNYKKPLYYIGKFPYDAQLSSNYEITWAMQILADLLWQWTLYLLLWYYICAHN